jgi:hypothetical protein
LNQLIVPCLTTPSKPDFVRILPPLLEKRRGN